MAEGKNNLREWLMGNPETGTEGLLAKNNLSLERLARNCDLTRSVFYYYIHDQQETERRDPPQDVRGVGSPL